MEQVDFDLVKAYAHNLQALLTEAELTERKAFLRCFIKRIGVKDEQVTIHYSLPLPQKGKNHQRDRSSVYSNPWWR